MKWFLLVLKKYAVFEGRARRKEYWYFNLFFFIFAVIVQVISLQMKTPLLYTLFVLCLIVPALGVAVRRMHDVNKSGWFIFIPIYNLILYFTDGTQGPNQYGPDPKRPEYEEFLSDTDLTHAN